MAKYRASCKPFRLFWVDVGKYDIALQNSHATVAVLKDAGVSCRGTTRAVGFPRMAELERLSGPVLSTSIQAFRDALASVFYVTEYVT